MAQRPSTPSSRRGRTTTARPASASRSSARGPVDVREWLSGIRFSGFTFIMLGLVVLAAFVLVPTASTFIAQQQRISALEAAIQVSQDDIAELERERERWSDPTYVAVQARERLYYIKPGEVVYLVNDDLDDHSGDGTDTPLSTTAQESGSDWMRLLAKSTIEAGLADMAAAP